MAGEPAGTVSMARRLEGRGKNIQNPQGEVQPPSFNTRSDDAGYFASK